MSHSEKTDIARFVSCFFAADGGILQSKGDAREMDQMKIGTFLKTLRKEKEITQEQLAEYLNTSRRTVSRWETGANLPDLDILMELADYYEVDLRELLDGERKSGKMDKELEETVLKVAEFSNETKERILHNMHGLFLGGIAFGILYFILRLTDHADNFLGGLCEGIMFGLMIVGAIITSRNAAKIRNFKMRLLNREKE